MQKFYFTFGSVHTCPDTPNFRKAKMVGKSLMRYYVTIEGDYETTRQAMFARYGVKWAFQYQEDQYEDSIKKFNLQELEFIAATN